MPRYKCEIAYDGSSFCGWQIQPNGLSIQQCIMDAFQTFLRRDIVIHGAGRTDAGVHAKGQVAHMDLIDMYDPQALLNSVNALLPKSIRIFSIQVVPDNFHARFSAKGKIYHYLITQNAVCSPFTFPYRCHIKQRVSIDLIKQATQYFIGTHDFTSFTNIGSFVKNCVRTIDRIDVLEDEEGFRLEFEGNGFLYKMIRNIVGTLLAIGSEQYSPDHIKEILCKKDRKAACKAAQAQGLYLMKVLY